MVSMKEIAKKCNVSVASVSKALNGYSDISEETRKIILKTASEMRYLPNSSARTLKTKRSYNIGVMLGTLQRLNNYFGGRQYREVFEENQALINELKKILSR